jgi:hypothetical protein
MSEDKLRDQIADYLMNQKVISHKIYSVEELMQTPEFKLIEVLLTEALTLEEITDKVDLKDFLKHLLLKLSMLDIVKKNEEGKWKISVSLIERMLETPETTEKVDIAEEKIPLTTPSKERESDIIIDQPRTTKEIDEILGDIEAEPSEIKSRIRAELLDKSTEAPDKEEAEVSSTDIEGLFDDVLESSMEDFLQDFDVIQVVESDTGKPVLGGPIITLLKRQKYIEGDLSTEAELLEVPEYEILSIIVKDHPIPLEKIEESAKTESVSLVLSNLQADDLVQQTNDYRWTISSKIAEILKSFRQEQEDKEKSQELEELRSIVKSDTKDEQKFLTALHKLEYIDNADPPLERFLHMAEVVLLKIIRDEEPIHLDDIKKIASEIPPVQVTRMVSRLEADNRIVLNNDEKWELTEEFIKIIAGED